MNAIYGNVFVLDVSGSMAGMKSQSLQLSAKRLIEDFADNSYVGIVLFDDNTEVAHKVVQITDRAVRDGLIQSVPQMARGQTDIGSGLLCALRALTDEGIATENSTIFVVTDGADTTGGSYVDRVVPTLMKAQAKVVAIAIGNDADPNLERLARVTGGCTYYASDVNREMAARVIEATIQEVKTSKELTESIDICVCDESLSLNQQLIRKNVVIDANIGRNTVFTIGSEDLEEITVEIDSPNGHKLSSELTRNQSLRRCQLKLKTTESGVWSISLLRHCNHIITANLSVKSQPLNPTAVRMRVCVKEADSNSPPIIIAELRKGSDAVIGAEVTATVDRPNGTQTRIKLINYNNIYCNYFTDYCGSGRYNASVLAKNITNNCQLKRLNAKIPVSFSVERFERQLIAGCFKVTDSKPSKPRNDRKLQELSLSPAFNSLAFNTSVNTCIEGPAPRMARAVIKPKVRAILEK